MGTLGTSYKVTISFIFTVNIQELKQHYSMYGVFDLIECHILYIMMMMCGLNI